MTVPINRHMQQHLIEMVKQKLLLERIALHGVNVNQKDQDGNNALFWAIKNGSLHNANLLISFSSTLMVNEKKHALFHAIESQQHEIVVLLIEKGLDINMIDECGKTLLMYAIEAAMFNTVRYLVHSGADIYLLDDDLNMAEDYAKAENNEEILSFLEHINLMDVQREKQNTHQCSCKN